MPELAATHPHMIVVGRPAQDHIDAFLLGNGSLGATVYGRPGEERLDLNLDSVWSGGPRHTNAGERQEVPLELLRGAIREGNHPEADRLARALQSESWSQSYQPLGGLLWSWSVRDADYDYVRSLNLATAEAITASGGAQLGVFVSFPDQVIVAHTDDERVTGALDFDSPHPGVTIRHETRDGAQWLTAVGRAPIRALPDYLDAPDPLLYGSTDLHEDAAVERGMGWAVVAAVDRDSNGGLRLIAAAASGFKGATVRPSADLEEIARQAQHAVDAARHRSVAELRRRHQDDYAALFDRGRIEVGAGASASGREAERYYNLGKYLLIASSRSGTQPATLQGIWNTERRAAWSCNYTTNINLPMNYWGAEPVGLSAAHEPLLRFVAELAESGKDAARVYYGARGATVHHNTDLWQFNAPVSGAPQWANWHFGLTWLAQHLLDALDFNWSEGFAIGTALPAVREVTSFVLDMLVEDSEGQLVVSPSTSPEHRFLDGDQIGTVTAGSTLDQELAHATLSGFLALVERLELTDERLAAECRSALPRLKLPQISSDGLLQEWADPSLRGSELGHRHLSHLYGCYPGTRITATRTPEEHAAVRESLAHRLAHGSGYTGWSQAWVLCLAARLRDPKLAQNAIETLVGDLSSESLLDLHPHPAFPSGRVFQIDGNLGAVAGIVELLLQSHDGAISLLPTLPTMWPAGRAIDLRARGGHTLRHLEWATGDLVSAEIIAGTDDQLTVEHADTVALSVHADGAPVESATRPAAAAGRHRTSWTSARGTRYSLLAQKA